MVAFISLFALCAIWLTLRPMRRSWYSISLSAWTVGESCSSSSTYRLPSNSFTASMMVRDTVWFRFLAAARIVQRHNLGADTLAAADHVLRHHEMIRRTRSNLRRMRDGQHLHFFRQPREPRADGIRNRSADAGIDFVEHECRRRATIREHDLQRE